MKPYRKAQNSMTIILAAALIAVFAVNNADAYSTGFEDIDYGSYASINYSWVQFTNNTGNLTVVSDIPGPDFSGTHSVIHYSNYDNPAERNIATLLVPGIRYVSVVMGDYDADEDPLYLEAYNAANQLIGSDYKLLPSDVYGGPTLSVSTTQDIAYAYFYSGGSYPGSVYFDNFTTNVPEPATICMLGLGALSLIRRKK